MRLQLKLRHPHNSLLPLNYQHYISAFIYKMLAQSAPEFTTWLHNQGFEKDGKHYKLFTFGRLRPQKYQIDAQRQLLQLQAENSNLTISFYVDDALQHFVQGLFQAQTFYLGDAFIGTDFEVEQINILPTPNFTDHMSWKVLSPMCISQKEKAARYAQYLAPDHPNYGALLWGNLLRKTKSVLSETDDLANTEFKFELLGDYRSKLIQIKNSKIRAFEFDFQLSADPVLQKMGYYAGFGEKNAQGFGLVNLK